MMRWMIALLLLAPSAAALEGSIEDTRGDASQAHDIESLSWTIDNATATLSLSLAAAPDPAAAHTIILYIGEEGAPEPDEWYIAHDGPGGGRILTGHTDPPSEQAHAATWADRTMTFTLDRTSPAEPTCAFAVAAVSIDEHGRSIQDAVPSVDEDLGAAWRSGAYCIEMPSEDVHVVQDQRDDDDGVSIPSVPVAIALATLVAVAITARRR